MAPFTSLVDLPFPYWLIAAAIVLLGLGCFALIVVLYSRRAFSLMQERKKKDLRFRYQYFLYDALVESQAGNDAPDFQTIVLARFREEEKKHPLDKQVLTNLLTDLKRSFTGSSEAQLLQVAESLQLSEYAYRKLHDRHWSIQVQGIREISAINSSNEAFRSAIADLCTSNTPLLSQEAQIALVKLSTPPDFSFLDNLSSPLSHWQQIHLLHHLRTVPREMLPDFSRWLTAENESIVLFSLRMITESEQHHAAELVLQQLTHPSASIVLEAIRTSKQLKLVQAVEPLLALMHHSDSRVQRASIQAIGHLGSAQHLDCLNPFLTHTDYWIRRTAADAIARLQSTSNLPIIPANSSLQPLD